jgi:NitT/TauT family transport system permease protein
MSNAAASVNTAKSKSGLGSVLFRPNASIPTRLYQGIVFVELFAFLGLWFLMPNPIPHPLEVFNTLSDMLLTRGLIGEFYTSVALNLQAITISTVLGLGIAYLSAIPVFRPIAKTVAVGRFVSLVGMGFLLTVYVGSGHALKLTELIIGMTVFFAVSMIDVVLQTSTEDLDYVRTLRSNEWEVMYQTQIRGTLGQAFDILRQNAAMGWLMLAMVEGTVRSEGGIGTMLVDSNKHLSLPAIFAIQSIFVMIGVGQDALIVWLKHIFAPWAVLEYSKGQK